MSAFVWLDWPVLRGDFSLTSSARLLADSQRSDDLSRPVSSNSGIIWRGRSQGPTHKRVCVRPETRGYVVSASAHTILPFFLGSETQETFFFHFVWYLLSFHGHFLQTESLTNTDHSGVCVAAVMFVQDVHIYP